MLKHNSLVSADPSNGGILHRCATGKHSSEKPVTKAAPSPNAPKPMQMAKTGDPALDAAKAACGRCRQGFFCSDHGLSSPWCAFPLLLKLR